MNGSSGNDAAPHSASSSVSASFASGTDVNTDSTAAELVSQDSPATAAQADDDAPKEYRNALRAAQRYLDFSGFSEAKLYHQLTSEYGSQYTPEAAQYAMDHITVDWNAEALESAESYIDFSGFSKAKLYDQLTSEYGEQFTAEQAQYAVDNVNADWMEEAVQSAESYQEFSAMSGAGLLDQLTSEYGEKFTMEEAQHAVNTLGL